MYIHINDRSRLDEVVAIRPGSLIENRPTVQTTQREELQIAQGRGVYYGRRDVVLINGIDGKRDYVLEVAENEELGFVGDTWILNILDAHQTAEVNNIARRMRENAKNFPPAMLLLNRS